MDFSKEKTNGSGFYLERILLVVDKLFDGNKAKFLRKCDLSSSYLDSMRGRIEKGKKSVPGADVLSNMINAAKDESPLFNPLWLIQEDASFYIEKEKGGTSLKYALDVLELAEQESLNEVKLPTEIELQLAKLLVKVLERRVHE